MTLHAIKRAKERYKLELDFDDLSFILNEILEGRAKEIKYDNLCGYEDKYNKNYRLRYKGKLIEPVVRFDKDPPIIVTFWPTGKRAARYLKNWIRRFKDENFIHLARKYGKDRNQ